MYLGVDIGGTKTLVATLDDNGVILEQQRFLTPQDYQEFLAETKNALSTLDNKDYKAGAVAVPAPAIDRLNRRALRFGNLAWSQVNIGQDIEDMVRCPILIENDAKLAALSEYMLLKDKYSKVLYVTISTGIGYASVVDGVIDIYTGDGGGRTIMLQHDGKPTSWETYASGHAIVERYGKMAKEIEDEETWQHIVNDLSDGMALLIGVFQPQVIVFGGSVGNYFSKFGNLLKESLIAYNIPLENFPDLVQAARPDEAVIYGCYDLAKAKY
jgi:predicted NBD/HSP70 family sugar kinase